MKQEYTIFFRALLLYFLVTFDDERPKAGFCTIHLKVPGMESGGMFSGGTPKNVEIKETTIEPEYIL